MTKPTAPDSVSPQEILELADLVLRTAGELTRFGDRVAGDHGQTAARSLIMGALDEAPASIAEVARRRGLRRQSVQEVMHRLERDGLVSRVPHSSRRSPTFELTESGRALRLRLQEAFRDWASDVADGLSQDALASTTATLRSLLAQEGRSAPADPTRAASSADAC